MLSIIEKLTEIFTTFPGIGKRQAERFVYYLLRQNKAFSKELTDAIQQLHKSVTTCTRCQRFFVGDDATECSICSNTSRDTSQLLLVAKDVDFENIEHSDTYKGYYFVLGGTVPILDKKPEEKVRIEKLKKLVQKQKPKEIILGLSTHPEGENTSSYVKRELSALQKKLDFTLSTLGRGLSTGAELEYSDPETIKNALANRG